MAAPGPATAFHALAAGCFNTVANERDALGGRIRRPTWMQAKLRRESEEEA